MWSASQPLTRSGLGDKSLFFALLAAEIGQLTQHTCCLTAKRINQASGSGNPSPCVVFDTVETSFCPSLQGKPSWQPQTRHLEHHRTSHPAEPLRGRALFIPHPQLRPT
jgi:hypothetical protein